MLTLINIVKIREIKWEFGSSPEFWIRNFSKNYLIGQKICSFSWKIQSVSFSNKEGGLRVQWSGLVHFIKKEMVLIMHFWCNESRVINPGMGAVLSRGEEFFGIPRAPARGDPGVGNFKTQNILSRGLFFSPEIWHL